MSRPIKRSFTIRGHRTSISLEAEFWDALKEIAAGAGTTLAGLVTAIDEQRGRSGLSGAVRVHVLAHYRRAAVSLHEASRALTSSAKSS